jgi:hypothetical protein
MSASAAVDQTLIARCLSGILAVRASPNSAGESWLRGDGTNLSGRPQYHEAVGVTNTEEVWVVSVALDS